MGEGNSPNRPRDMTKRDDAEVVFIHSSSTNYIKPVIIYTVFLF